MLKEINKLFPFFEDCYREINVREYSRLVEISPPSASIFLKNLEFQGLLKSKLERRNLLFQINSESILMRDLSRIYWNQKLQELVSFLEKGTFCSSIVLFGSLSKLEVTKESDIDIAIFGVRQKDLDLSILEKKLGRKIQLFFFESLEKVNKQLKTNIINGYLLRGYLS